MILKYIENMGLRLKHAHFSVDQGFLVGGHQPNFEGTHLQQGGRGFWQRHLQNQNNWIQLGVVYLLEGPPRSASVSNSIESKFLQKSFLDPVATFNIKFSYSIGLIKLSNFNFSNFFCCGVPFVADPGWALSIHAPQAPPTGPNSLILTSTFVEKRCHPLNREILDS